MEKVTQADLIAYIESLTPEQIKKLISRLPELVALCEEA